MVPFIAFIYGRMGIDTLDAQYMLFNLAFTMVATFVQSSLIAEEKEKNTLRGLMLSPANTAEILVGKSLLSFLMTVIVVLLSALLLDYVPENMFLIGIAMILSICFYIGLGTLLGLYTKSVMEASVIVLPFMIIFAF